MKFRTIWLSDIHLGTKGCRSDRLLDFLRKTESEYLFLVGDIIDFWALKRAPFWPTEHNTVIQKVLKKARHGTQVYYIPGNHDEIMRQYIEHEIKLGNISMVEEHVHELANGKKILCLHGDEFDIVTRYHKWLAVLGDVGYTFLLWLNRTTNKIRFKIGMNQWSLANFVKHKVKKAVNFISSFEENVAKEVKERGYDGALCGHIHHAEIRTIDGVLYLNTGDWVESCTAIVEDYRGNLRIIRWLDENSSLDN